MTANRMFCGLLLLSAVLVAVLAVTSVRLPEGKNWIDLVQAMGTPSVALLAAYFTWKNYHLTRAKRRDDLFDRRFKLYEKIREYYVINCENFFEISDLEQDEVRPGIPLEQVRFANEAQFIFGMDVVKHIRELHRRDAPIYPPHIDWYKDDKNGTLLKKIEQRKAYPPPPWFDEPFLNYMKLDQ